MTVLFFLSVPGFREREYRVVFRIESDGGIERYAFLALEPLDESGGAGGEKLFQMGVGQFLVQNAAEHQQPASVMVAPGHFGTEDDFSRLALGAGECPFLHGSGTPGAGSPRLPCGCNPGWTA